MDQKGSAGYTSVVVGQLRREEGVGLTLREEAAVSKESRVEFADDTVEVVAPPAAKADAPPYATLSGA